MRGHCLIWNEWVPAWVKNMSVPERKAFFDEYIEDVVGRYEGKLQSWDIVNEPFWPGHKAPGGIDSARGTKRSAPIMSTRI